MRPLQGAGRDLSVRARGPPLHAGGGDRVRGLLRGAQGEPGHSHAGTGSAARGGRERAKERQKRRSGGCVDTMGDTVQEWRLYIRWRYGTRQSVVTQDPAQWAASFPDAWVM